MTTPQEQPAPPDGMIQAQVGLAETPLGQKVALILTILLPREAAAGVAGEVAKQAAALSSTRLVVAQGNGSTGAVAQRPG